MPVMPVQTTKPAHASVGVWGGGASGATAVALLLGDALGKVTLDGATWVGLLGIVLGSAASVWGRWRAPGPIGQRDETPES